MSILKYAEFAHLIPTLGSTVVELRTTNVRNSREYVPFVTEPQYPSTTTNVSKKTQISRYESVAFKFREFNKDEKLSVLSFSFLPTEFKEPRQTRTSTFTTSWEETPRLIQDKKPTIEPYWVISRFNSALRTALNAFLGTESSQVRAGVTTSFFEILENSSFSTHLDTAIKNSDQLFSILDTVVEELNQIIRVEVLRVVNMQVAAQRSGKSIFRGANLFSTAYDKVLMRKVFGTILPRHDSIIPPKTVEFLGILRSCFLECDVALETALMTITNGLWASVRLTDNGIPADPINVTFIDLFAGIGSFRKAFEAAGAKCVWTNDIIPESMTCYSENFDIEENELLTGDIRSVIPRHIKSLDQGGLLLENLNRIPNMDIDFVLGGFPCKSFSSIGQMVRRSTSETPAQIYSKLFLEDVRYGRLIFDTLEVISQVNAKGFMFENVPEFIDMWVPKAIVDPNTYKNQYGFDVDFSNTKMRETDNLDYFGEDTPERPRRKIQPCVNLFEAVILPAFKALRSDGHGFNVTWDVSNARNYGAQSRNRVFIVGIRKDIEDMSFNFKNVPFASSIKPPSFQETMCHLRSERAEPPYTLPFGQGSIVNPKYNVSLAEWGRLKEKIWKKSPKASDFDTFIPSPLYNRGKFGIEVLPETLEALKKDTNRDKFTYYGTLLASGVNELKYVVFQSVVDPSLTVYRCITPREAARLMTFDPDRVTRMPSPTTDFFFYQQCGFSIVTRHLKEITLLLCFLFNRSKPKGR